MSAAVFNVVIVFFDASARAWMMKTADGNVHPSGNSDLSLSLFEVAEAAKEAAHANICEVFVGDELRLAYAGPDQYQWLCREVDEPGTNVYQKGASA